MSENKLLLTISFLVSNRIDTIGRLMESLRPLAEGIPSEIIAVDTGSYDGSIEVVEKYADKILMFDNPRDAFAISEFLLGIDINSENPDELQQAADKLAEQKPLVQSYVMDQIYQKMEHEEAWIAPYYAGDYLMMKEENEDLAFYFPEEGFNLFIDAICISTSCQNKDAAEAYINFLCSPEISGQNLEYLGYSTPVPAAKDYMDEEVANSEIAYPNSETLSLGDSFLYLSADANQLMDSLWLDVKTDGGNISTYAILAGVVVVLAIVAYLIIHTQRKKRRKQKRGNAQ